MQNTQRSALLQTLNKKYEERSLREHRLLYNAISGCFSTHSEQKIKMMTFYLQLRQGPLEISTSEYSKHSFVLTFKHHSHENAFSMQMIAQKGVNVAEGDFVCILDYQKYLNVEALGETSIEKQVNFFESSEYFCSMPKKKLIQLLRECQIRGFKEKEVAFFQGQLMTKTESGSGVFVIRTGEFGYFKENDSKEIQTFRFGSGNILGTLQILERDNARNLTARCKTQKSVVYRFSQQTFRKLMLRYCETAIRTKQEKLFKFTESREIEMFKSKSLSVSFKKTNLSDRKSVKPMMTSSNFDSAKSMINTGRKVFPSITTEELKQTTRAKFASTGFFRQSMRIEEEGMKRSTYLSIRKEGPLRSYPMASQRSNFISSQFKILDKVLLQRKEVGKQVKAPSAPFRQNGVWRRDMIHSFYRQNFFKTMKRNPETTQF